MQSTRLAFAEYTAWHLINAPTFGNAVTLTTLDAVKF